MDEILTRGVEKIYPSADFLEKRLSSGEKLTVYLGIDPTGPSLHVGHLVPLLKLADFQKAGHRVILLIGDTTATIGDPDKHSVRQPLTRDEVLSNAAEYKKQAAKFLSFTGDNKAEIRYNSKWFSKMTMPEVLGLASHVTVGQMLERDMFKRRIEEGRPIYLHEFLYPLMQGYDSVSLGVDGEVGGNDQTFNMLTGRDLSRTLSGKEKFVIAVSLLTDKEGNKMGKTTGNMVNFSDDPSEIYGKVMSWPDAFIIPGFVLATRVSRDDIAREEDSLSRGANPKDSKQKLAFTLVSSMYGDRRAKEAEEYFRTQFERKEVSAHVPAVVVPSGRLLVDLLIDAALISSKSEFRRLIEESAVVVTADAGEIRLSDPHFVVTENLYIKIGKKRFLKIRIG